MQDHWTKSSREGIPQRETEALLPGKNVAWVLATGDKDAPAGSRANLSFGSLSLPCHRFLARGPCPYPYLPETQLVLSDY